MWHLLWSFRSISELLLANCQLDYREKHKFLIFLQPYMMRGDTCDWCEVDKKCGKDYRGKCHLFLYLLPEVEKWTIEFSTVNSHVTLLLLLALKKHNGPNNMCHRYTYWSKEFPILTQSSPCYLVFTVLCSYWAKRKPKS